MRATDADDPKEPYGEREYSLVTTDNNVPTMFRIDRVSGKVYTVAYGLDREVKQVYHLLVKVS